MAPGPNYDPFTPSGHLDGSATMLLKPSRVAACAAWAGVPDDAEGAPPVWVAIGAAALDAAVHAWDIAGAVGTPNPISQDDAPAPVVGGH